MLFKIILPVGLLSLQAHAFELTGDVAGLRLGSSLKDAQTTLSERYDGYRQKTYVFPEDAHSISRLSLSPDYGKWSDKRMDSPEPHDYVDVDFVHSGVVAEQPIFQISVNRVYTDRSNDKWHYDKGSVASMLEKQFGKPAKTSNKVGYPKKDPLAAAAPVIPGEESVWEDTLYMLWADSGEANKGCEEQKCGSKWLHAVVTFAAKKKGKPLKLISISLVLRDEELLSKQIDWESKMLIEHRAKSLAF